MTHYKSQLVEIKEVDFLAFEPGGQNKKDVKMKVSPAMSFRINTTLHIVGVAAQLAAMFMKRKEKVVGRAVEGGRQQTAERGTSACR